MEIWTALMLGIVGSLHCAGMCGPLALALPNAGATRTSFYAGRAGYNLGRITAYAILGLAFGLVGQTMALAGFQRWASLAAGAALLLAAMPFSRFGLGWSPARTVALLKAALAAVLRRRSVSALYLLGILNGFLPCGLVYAACAAALTLGTVLGAVTYMAAFGLGTVPMMFGISLVRENLGPGIRLKLGKLVPVSLAILGVLLILRGMSLGIPYLSPDLAKCH